MTVSERLDRLERQNRRLRMGLGWLLVAVVAASILGFASQVDPIPEVITARAIHVVAEDGTVLVKIEDTHGLNTGFAGTMTTFNGKGEEIVVLTATKGGEGNVITKNRKGQKIVELGVTLESEGRVETFNGKGQRFVALTANKNGEGVVFVFDPSGRHRRGLLLPGE